MPEFSFRLASCRVCCRNQTGFLIVISCCCIIFFFFFWSVVVRMSLFREYKRLWIAHSIDTHINIRQAGYWWAHCTQTNRHRRSLSWKWGNRKHAWDVGKPINKNSFVFLFGSNPNSVACDKVTICIIIICVEYTLSENKTKKNSIHNRWENCVPSIVA